MEDEEEREFSDDFRPGRANGLGAIDLDADDDLELDDDDELDAGLIEDAADEDDEDVSPRDSGPLEGEQAERELLRRDARSGGHRRPAGMPPPAKRVVRRRGAGMAARAKAGKGRKRAKS